MGDTKKLKKKYSTPAHPWNKNTIEVEKKLVQEFGLKKKKEIHIANSFLKKYKNIAKSLIADKTAQGIAEKKLVLAKLQRFGLIQADAELDQILGIELKDVLERRLQSVVCRKGLAKTMNQARQFITHRQIMIGDKEITSPSHLITMAEVATVVFKPTSALASAEHPERMTAAKPIKEKTYTPKTTQKTRRRA